MEIDFNKQLTAEQETFIIEQYHKIIDSRYGLKGQHETLVIRQNGGSIEEYENKIGMTKLKDAHLQLRRETGGKKGKYWMALSPKWITGHKMDTKYLIAYWVNYGDDEVYGWFTVEQIRQWLETPNLKLYELGGTRERIR